MRYYVVDAFAEKIFQGNPAGVCIMEAWLPDALMLDIAVENNLSETAFAVREGDGYKLRWFTPGGEINLCGHATLATAFIIANFVDTRAETISFSTLSGTLTVKKSGGLYAMDFPSIPSKPHPVTPFMVEALGVVPVEAYTNRDYVFVLGSEEAVAGAAPDFSKLAALPEGLAVFITAKGKNCDFVSRAFWPKLGINEDPVCGSMHCSLIPFWSERLGKKNMTARQLSKRGGTIFCEDRGGRVTIGGTAVLYAVADIRVE